MIAQHEGFIHSGKGLVLRVFEQARRAYGKRIVHLREEGFQVFLQLFREWRRQKSLHDLGVILALQGEIQQVVLGHELIEGVGCQDEGGRNCDANAWKTARDTVLAEEMSNEN